MKKSILFISICFAILFTFSVKSQSIQLYDGSGIIANGSDIYLWGDSASTTTMTKSIYIKNISSNTVIVKAKKIETSLLTGATCSICFVSGCYPSTVFISPSSDTLSPNACDSTFKGDYKPKGHLGESIITFVFFNVTNKNDSSWVKVHYNSTPLIINEAVSQKTEISNPYPNPAANYTTFNYSFPQNTTNAKFILNDLLGTKVFETSIPDQNGKLIININEIKNGVYFYNFYVNSKLVLTKKLIIQH